MQLVLRRSRRTGAALFIFLVAALLFSAASASALTIPLTQEFDGDLPAASYATVDVVANSGDLEFTITLGGLLGAGADLHELYFNLVGSFTGLSITTDNAPNSAYTALIGPSVAGGAGSSFTHGVSFGNGGGPPGNGVLKVATFTLSANEALSVDDLLLSSFTSSGIEAQIALHIQGTSTPNGSETVGGVPEPGAFAFGALAALAFALRRGGR
ncbi:MAG: hypothetical protein GY937_01105 [bacterium]|nr:hypothetical protein [bacterium]